MSSEIIKNMLKAFTFFAVFLSKNEMAVKNGGKKEKKPL
nr:MAG TPA: hypothetical protein [Caudoviricetes sp.]